MQFALSAVAVLGGPSFPHRNLCRAAPVTRSSSRTASPHQRSHQRRFSRVGVTNRQAILTVGGCSIVQKFGGSETEQTTAAVIASHANLSWLSATPATRTSWKAMHM
ncbi:hypothetical protein B0H13DRAFT_1889178 [Mycena leptocephala]|nr:hypothetical protein B0H13DRAFT_1889178 [Mycena leptocephala]